MSGYLQGCVTLLLSFALTLTVAVLISARARRGVLSTTVLFLAVGFVLGSDWGILDIPDGSPLLHWTTEIGLFSVLLMDGMHAPRSALREGWREPARVLAFGLPLSVVFGFAVGLVLLDLPWLEALLLAAALAPTDPLLAEAIIGRESVPWRIRHTLNVESGFNDGLALPLVLVLLPLAGSGGEDIWVVVGHLAEGIAIGAVIPAVLIRLERTEVFGASERYRTLGIIALGLLVFGTASAVDANLFVAAFTAGITIGTLAPDAPGRFEPTGRAVTELLKLGAVFLVGAVLARHLLESVGWAAGLFAILMLVAVRPASVAIAMLGSSVPAKERFAVAWFGPKGFASVLYSLLVLRSGVPYAGELFGVATLTIGLSIVAHSSTDVLVARWVGRAPESERADRVGSAQER